MSAPLLGPDDPTGVVTMRARSRVPVVLTCEHGGNHVPRALNGLGVAPKELERHIGYDIGALGVTKRIGDRLGAVCIAQVISRLVIDCNRPFDAPDLIPEVSDGTPVPGNTGLSAEDRRARIEEVHGRFHSTVRSALDRNPGAALVAVHSYSPQRNADAAPRPWHCGFLWRQDGRFAEELHDAMAEPGLVMAHNRPYEIEDHGDYTIPVHGEARGIPHVLLEIRQDLIADADGQRAWADRLATALSRVLPEVIP